MIIECKDCRLNYFGGGTRLCSACLYKKFIEGRLESLEESRSSDRLCATEASTIGKMNDRIKKLEDKNCLLKIKGSDSVIEMGLLEKDIRGLNAKIEELESHNRGLYGTIAEMDSEIYQFNKVNKRLCEDREGLEADNLRIVTANVDLSKNNKKLEDDFNATCSTIDHLGGVIRDQQEKIADLKRQKEGLFQSLNATGCLHVPAVFNKLAERGARIAELETENIELRGYKQRMDSNVPGYWINKDIADKLGTANTALEVYHRAMHKDEAEIKRLNGRLNSLMASETRRVNLIAELNRDNSSLRDGFSKPAMNIIHDREKEIRELEVKLMDAKSTDKWQDDIIKAQRDKIHELKEKIVDDYCKEKNND